MNQKTIAQQKRAKSQANTLSVIIGVMLLAAMAATCHHDPDTPHYASATYEGVDGKPTVHCFGIDGNMKCHDDSQGQP